MPRTKKPTARRAKQPIPAITAPTRAARNNAWRTIATHCDCLRASMAVELQYSYETLSYRLEIQGAEISPETGLEGTWETASFGVSIDDCRELVQALAAVIAKHDEMEKAS